MELAIPILALGGLFIINNQQNKNKKKDIYLTQQKETFENMGKKTNYLPNTDTPPQNFPVINDAQLVDTVQEYPNPNQSTDKYFNQNYFEEQNRMGKKTGQNPQDVFSLTGNYLKTEEFVHNNMVPFYGAKMKGGNYKNEDAQIFLDNMSGAGSQVYNKIEQAPLFKPEDNIQWAYGSPVSSDFYQSRVNPGMNNSNVKPFDSIQVGPGLNQGFTSEGSNGYNSGMEVRNLWIDKTVDELRIATNPKESFSLINHEGPAESHITNVGKIGVVEKYRPDTFFINTQDRWLTTTGEQKGNRLIPVEMVNETKRNTTTSQFMGPASAQLKTASYTPIEHEPSKRNELESFDKYPSHSYGGNKGLTDDHLTSINIEKNNRSSCNKQPSFGASFNRSVGAVLLPFMDMLKPTRKEEYDCNVRVFGNPGSSVPNNILELNGNISPTIKETTLYAPHSYIQRQAGGGGYLSNEQRPTDTQRRTTGETCYVSTPGGSATSYGEALYNSYYNQTNNDKKEGTICGRTNQGNLNLFTGNANVAIHNKEKNCTYMGTPGLINPLTPSIQPYTKVNHNPCDNQTYNLERIQPDLLNAFKENPYTHSLTTAV